MANKPLSAKTRAALSKVSVATLSTALMKKGFRNVVMQGVTPVAPVGKRRPNMVGEAFTLRYIPAREDLDVISGFAGRTHPQRVAVEQCPPGCVFVIDSRKDPQAASAGNILVTRLMKRGVVGVVTDGGFRDTPAIVELGFPAYANRPSSPTNLTRHHALDIDNPIGCGDVAVYPRDVIVGDGEAVAVIPAHLADEIAEEATRMTEFENFVEKRVMKGQSIFGLYPPEAEMSAAFAAEQKKKKRK